MAAEHQQEWPDKELLETLIAYLDNPEDQRGVWRGLHFMEANGLNWSMRYEELHGYFTDLYNSPLKDPEELPHEQERKILLGLRDVVRQDLHLPPLTEEEKKTWQYERQEHVQWRPDQLIPRVWAETYHPTSDDISEIKESISAHHPDVMRALILSARDNVSTDGQRGKVHSTIWITHRLTKLVAAMRPDLDAMGIDNCVHLLMQGIRESAKTTL